MTPLTELLNTLEHMGLHPIVQTYRDGMAAYAKKRADERDALVEERRKQLATQERLYVPRIIHRVGGGNDVT